MFPVPYFIYQEFLESGTLRDVLMRIQESLQYPSKDNRELNICSHLVGFSKDIVNGVQFLHSNKVIKKFIFLFGTFYYVITPTSSINFT